MTVNPLISVIMPVYNGEDTLNIAIKSILDQSYHNFEFIICLDGCTDDSEKIINSFSDKRIKLFKSINRLGLGRNMNRLMYKTSNRSEFIAIAEQDDYYYPNRLKLQIEYLLRHPQKGIVSGIAEFFNGSDVTYKFPGILVNGNEYPTGEAMFLLNYLEQTKIVNSCMMIRKNIHEENGLYFSTHYPNIAIDWQYYLRFSLISEIGGLNAILVRMDRSPYRVSITQNRNNYNKAARELLKNIKFEYPDIINRQHYRYALNTQRLIELGHYSGTIFIFYMFVYLFINPLEIRFYNYFIKRIKRYFRL